MPFSGRSIQFWGEQSVTRVVLRIHPKKTALLPSCEAHFLSELVKQLSRLVYPHHLPKTSCKSCWTSEVHNWTHSHHKTYFRLLAFTLVLKKWANESQRFKGTSKDPFPAWPCATEAPEAQSAPGADTWPRPRKKALLGATQSSKRREMNRQRTPKSYGCGAEATRGPQVLVLGIVIWLRVKTMLGSHFGW